MDASKMFGTAYYFRKYRRRFMFEIDVKSRKSIYEQVVDNFREMIISGLLEPEEKLPSVRSLSRSLTVNPNTIQKAYRELEHQGYIYTVTGRGSFVKERKEETFDKSQIMRAEDDLRTAVRDLVFMGISDDKIRSKVDEFLSVGGEKS